MHTHIAHRVVARFLNLAMEHDSPEALKKYLHDHPGAIVRKHHVKKPKGDEKGESSEKGQKNEPMGHAHSLMQGMFDKNDDPKKLEPKQIKELTRAIQVLRDAPGKSDAFRERARKVHEAIKKGDPDKIYTAWSQLRTAL